MSITLTYYMAICSIGLSQATPLGIGSSSVLPGLRPPGGIVSTGDPGHVDHSLRINHELFQAIYVRNLDKVKKLLEEGGADVNHRRMGSTPLHSAARSDWPQLGKVLMEEGADPDARDNTGRTPLHVAAQFNSVHMAQMLANSNLTHSNLTGDVLGRTALHLAAMHDSALVAKALLRAAGDQPEWAVEANDLYGRTALHFAAGTDSLTVAALLLSYGADVNALDEKGSTPLHYAAKKDSARVGQLLLSHGAMVAVVDGNGKTPLDVARMFGSTELGLKIMLMTSVPSETTGGRIGINGNVAFAPHFSTNSENYIYDYETYDY